MLFAASAFICSGLSPSSLAQGPAGQKSTGRAPAAATVDGATAAAIAAEGELKATIRTFQSDNPEAGRFVGSVQAQLADLRVLPYGTFKPRERYYFSPPQMYVGRLSPAKGDL